MLFAFLFLLFSLPANALKTSYLILQEPKNWSCSQQAAEYLCRSLNPLEQKESFLTVKAKLASREDSLQAFYVSLKQPLISSNGVSQNQYSKVYFVKQELINQQYWIHALHLNSNIPNYFTEYLVTLKGDLAIGIELNFHQSRYSKYKDKMIEISNKLQLVENIASRSQKVTNAPQNPAPLNTAPPSFINRPINEADSRNDDMYKIVYFGVGVLLVFALLLLSKRN
ncbi:MAG: hypothetical protein KDD40_04420 [Bdellovibrionales bacterium]|nr:hypothetical protein [Bdellovibrionales bacterium]